MTGRQGTGRQMITVGRLLRRQFLRMLAELRVHGYDVRAELVSSGVFECDYELTWIASVKLRARCLPHRWICSGKSQWLHPSDFMNTWAVTSAFSGSSCGPSGLRALFGAPARQRVRTCTYG